MSMRFGVVVLIRRLIRLGCVLACLLAATAIAGAQEIVLQCDAAQTAADFNLGDSLHTVKGSFALKSGEIHFDPATEKISGEIVFDATSGQSGSKGRDRKMHKDVLESAQYPEIGFRPDRVEGKVAASGTSSVQVHGMFRIHGAEHEITAPTDITPQADHWNVSSHFSVPYAKWGMKNPSLLFLRVGNSVDITFHGTCAVASLVAR
jgi:polyisoprenoid-binding protein YceI